MTELLKKAFETASELPEDEQNIVAAWLLDELASERRWRDQFANSEDVLARLADEAIEEYKAERTRELDPEAI